MKFLLSLIRLVFLLVYLVLLYFCLPLGTIIGKELIKYSCEFYVCSNVMYPREVPYIMINYVTIPNFIFFILPLWGIIGAFWFFVFKKLYTEIKKKKYIKIFFYFAVVLIFVRLFCFVFWLLLLTMSYDTELKLINFTLEYSLEVRRGPLKILSDVF